MQRIILISCSALFTGLTVSCLYLLAENSILKGKLHYNTQKVKNMTATAKSLDEKLKKISSYVTVINAVSNNYENKNISKLEKLSNQSENRLAYWDYRLIETSDTIRRVSVLLNHHKNLWKTLPDTAPTNGYLSSTFGKRVSPFSGQPVDHLGIDIGAKKGTNVVASADGTVHAIGHSPSYGKYVILSHGYNTKTKYAHNNKLLVRKGQKVKRGQKIALVGSTGQSTGPHLHFELWIAGKAINPLHYLSQSQLNGNTPLVNLGGEKLAN